MCHSSTYKIPCLDLVEPNITEILEFFSFLFNQGQMSLMLLKVLFTYYIHSTILKIEEALNFSIGKGIFNLRPSQL